MNRLCQKIGLTDLIKYEEQSGIKYKSIYGDVLEALIGAVYLDHGFDVTRKFVFHRLIQPHYDFDEMLNTSHNHKSKIIEWSQKENREVEFELIKEPGKISRQFVVQLTVDQKPISKGYGFRKKKAEQDAARKALDLLKKNES